MTEQEKRIEEYIKDFYSLHSDPRKVNLDYAKKGYELAEKELASLRSELAEKEKEIEFMRRESFNLVFEVGDKVKMLEVLSELNRFIPSLEYLADKGINEPKNCLNALSSFSKLVDQLKNTKP